ncbi:MAG: hypothetical protein ACJ72S_18705 [Nitrososphaeraceae archaeon]
MKVESIKYPRLLAIGSVIILSSVGTLFAIPGEGSVALASHSLKLV